MMNSQTVWSSTDSQRSATAAGHSKLATHARTTQDGGPSAAPWDCPRTVAQDAEREDYASLKGRLAAIPTRSKQKRQSLYLDLWTGQHWLGVKLSSPENSEILKPVSVDTALSVATVGTYRLLNQPLFAES